MQTRNIVTMDGVPLVFRTFPADKPSGKSAFVTHSQALHTLNISQTMQGLADRGWTVHGIDLRGHGYSVSERAPYAHLEIGRGWDDLVSDFKLGLEAAFDGIPWEDRLIVAPNIGALLVLECLKAQPDLARNIVFVTPPPNQPGLMKLARSITRVRALLHPPERPDELTFYQLYTFLGAHLEDRKNLIDVISSDKAFTQSILDDPYAWPTPTTGYFYELFRGIEKAWKWPRNIEVKEGTRVLLLYGGDDPMTANGRFIAPIRKHFNKVGVYDVESHCVEGGRTALFAEDRRFGISSIINDWCEGLPLNPDNTSREAADGGGIEGVSKDILQRLGLADFRHELKPDALVELCYGAISDDNRWIEMLYRVAFAASGENGLEEQELETIVAELMPHWDRSFSLNRQIMRSAAVGAVLHEVIERFEIGMAIVNDDFEISYANRPFMEAVSTLVGGVRFDADSEDMVALSNALAMLLNTDFRNKSRKSQGEALLMVGGKAVGFHFRPQTLRQTSLNRQGASGVMILRAADTETRDLSDTFHELLQFGYGLTAKEAQAACCLVNGLSPTEISRQLDVSIHTTRTHLKRVYEKVGVQGQTELTARLLQGPLGLLADGK
ncbi:serine aminopeptidase domain-containing protein [Roseibium aggregatum]|uniref:Alpha/beta hydrolase n=1 Tax=Roseibium aggregatum TaxID=187304 RepID=A0A939EFP9_9HYPH|nr:alpha/beta hydrolase [Roseibium aggregatum]MBN9672153.1 alpha/beta hydrolase [Roseibium aggregatum]